jgi:hypothetical protein
MATKPVYEDDVEETPEFTPRPNVQPNPIFAAGEEQGKRQPSGDASVAEENSGPRTQPVAKKPAIVTKEQLAKSGYDNLRDYLNAQQGLTRRKDMTEKAPAKMEEKPAAKTGSIMDKSPAERDAMIKLGLQRQEAERAMKEFKAKKASGYAKGGMTGMKSVKKMASGGMTASSRGDGIAQRGKTRGKMC